MPADACQQPAAAHPHGRQSAGAIESIMLACMRVSTYDGCRLLTGASGFLYARGERLFFVTSRHVLIDRPSGHLPDRIELTLHVDAVNLTRVLVFSVPLYENGRSAWRQAEDSGGDIDVAAIELDRKALPATLATHAFTAAHLQGPLEDVGIGSPLVVLGFPLGFYDTVHYLPVARQASVASAFGIRFQGEGYFLTDARTHRGTSGAPVVMRDPSGDPALPWKLLGIHSARMDVRNREEGVDETLSLNCAWYADILHTLTQ